MRSPGDLVLRILIWTLDLEVNGVREPTKGMMDLLPLCTQSTAVQFATSGAVMEKSEVLDTLEVGVIGGNGVSSLKHLQQTMLLLA